MSPQSDNSLILDLFRSMEKTIDRIERAHKESINDFSDSMDEIKVNVSTMRQDVALMRKDMENCLEKLGDHHDRLEDLDNVKDGRVTKLENSRLKIISGAGAVALAGTGGLNWLLKALGGHG